MKRIEGKELLFSDIYKGMEFSEVTYTLTADILKKYLEAIDDLNPLYLDEDYAKRTPYGGTIAPPISMAIYITPSYVLRPSGWKTPPGCIQAQQRFEFTGIVRPGDKLVIKTVIDDKYERKGRKFVVFKSEVINQKGEKVGTSWLTPIWSI